MSLFTTLSGRSSVFLQKGHRVRNRSSKAVRSVCAKQPLQSGCLQHACLTPRFAQPGMAQRGRRLLANCLAILERNVRLPPGCVRDCRIVADLFVQAVTLVICLWRRHAVSRAF